jgi:guanylate kinase
MFAGPRMQGRLVIISGPSGAGKTSVLRRVLEESPLPLKMSVSATTRRPRPGEVDGVDYHFLTKDRFQAYRQEGRFLECVEVFGKDVWYGTLRDEVVPELESGTWVVLEIDVEGARRVKREFPDAITLFIHPRSNETLEKRLRGRATESEPAIARRLARAKAEMAAASEYDHVVVNDDLDEAVRKTCNILAETNQRK